MAPDGANPEGSSFAVILEEQLKAAIASCNPELPVEVQINSLKLVLRLNDQNIIVNNRLLHQYLTEGVPVEYRKDGAMRGDRVQLIDFNQLDNNEWLIHHPKEALIFSQTEETWKELEDIYTNEFGNLVHGTLPEGTDVMNSLKLVSERIKDITWRIDSTETQI
jgi:hypothetical protein